MKVPIKTLWIAMASLISLSCNAQKTAKFKPEEVYKTDDLVITRISEHAFEHTSFKKTDDFGYVPCNGLVVVNDKEVIIFDTPTNDTSALRLIKWIRETMHCNINAVIPTHFHDDCLGGLKAFDDAHIPSYAYFKTIELAREHHYTVPKNSFRDSLTLKAGDATVIVKYFGEGHTKDNVVAYFPEDNILFGGCLIKELNAGKGYLGDANIAAWPGTVTKIKNTYPDVSIVVPGHGVYGNQSLLDYTIQLFKAP